MFGYAIYLSYFILDFDKLNSKLDSYSISIFYILLGLLLPLLRGHLISDKFKIKFRSYFQLWKYKLSQMKLF